MTQAEKRKILDKVAALVQQKYFDPHFNGRNWPALVADHRNQILSTSTEEAFEDEMNALLFSLGTSHTGFLSRKSHVSSGNSIQATVRPQREGGQPRWVFQDVQPGGPADQAGIQSGDVLVAIQGRPIAPPTPPEFRMGTESVLTVIHQNGTRRERQVELKTPQAKHVERPYAEPREIVAKRLENNVGYLKVPLFPGAIGIDFAQDVDRAVAQIQDCDRLVIDLRGNPGGGIGGLRLMSYLTPDRIPVGYSLTRRRAERGYDKHRLPQFRGIPRSKWELPLLAFRFAGRDLSIAVVTEGKKVQRFHRRVAVLVNEHTAGAAEMLTAFVRENRLGSIVGTKTAGRLLAGKGFRVGSGYVAVIPVGCYLSWQGHRFEGNGIEPDVLAEWSAEHAQQGVDQQLRKAVEVAKSLQR